MNGQEKIEHLDVLNEIRNRINGCFGSVDLKWGNPLDEKRAKEIRERAFENNISFSDIQDIILGFLFRKGASLEHIEIESKKAFKFFKIKLSISC